MMFMAVLCVELKVTIIGWVACGFLFPRPWPWLRQAPFCQGNTLGGTVWWALSSQYSRQLRVSAWVLKKELVVRHNIHYKCLNILRSSEMSTMEYYCSPFWGTVWPPLVISSGWYFLTRLPLLSICPREICKQVSMDMYKDIAHSIICSSRKL